MSNRNPRIAVIGLGYVGLPLATALAFHFPVIGFDIDEERVKQLNTGYDRTGEVDKSTLQSCGLHSTTNMAELTTQDVYIITVPTPIAPDKTPDLSALEAASRTVGKALGPGAVVVYESTVYPGITEEFCGPILEEASDLKAGKDFFLGYSPERINPGDKAHTIQRITKIISAQTPEATALLRLIYGTVNNDNIFVAASIRVAEAAKVIENTQRDINIAFINELTMLMHKLGLSVYEVLAAAQTKWNFLPFQPGLVGGHCIGIDPYYLAYCAQQHGFSPQTILAGRQVNEDMSTFIAHSLHHHLLAVAPPTEHRLLILGLTFKENIPDIRNTKIIDLIHHLRQLGYVHIDVHDIYADSQEVRHEYGIDLLPALPTQPVYSCIVGAVAHQTYKAFTTADFQKILSPGGVIADIRYMWPQSALPPGTHYWTL